VPNPAAFRFRDLTVGYAGRPAVHHLNGAVVTGSLTAIVGPNGGGKTTLLNAMAGRLLPLGGTIEFDQAGARVAYLPQQADIERAFPIDVFELVSLGAWSRIGITHCAGAALRDEVAEAIAQVGLGGFENRPIGSLSAGQFQRALFARVLLSRADIVLLDEPFNAIDARTTRELIDLVKRWHTARRTVVVVLHDLDQVRDHFPECLLLARECIAWGPTPTVLSAPQLERARQLAEHWDEDAPWCARPAPRWS
jgi:zinc/manganese transport system ATP-binding protein